MWENEGSKHIVEKNMGCLQRWEFDLVLLVVWGFQQVGFVGKFPDQKMSHL